MASRVPSLDSETRHLAEGEAALVLMESLLLTLVNKGVLRRDEIVQSIESLIDVKREMAADDRASGLSAIAAGILIGVANSLSAEDEPFERTTQLSPGQSAS